MDVPKFVILTFGPMTAILSISFLMDQKLTIGIYSTWVRLTQIFKEITHWVFKLFFASRKKDYRAVLKELPELLDIISLSMGAGTGFDSALALYCSRNKGMLASDFARAMGKWRAGLCTREEALNAVTHKYEIPELTSFVESVNEALRIGAPVTDVLQGQSASARKKWKYNVSVKIERAPVKMLLPVGTLVLPALLLSILGPLAGSLN